MRLTAPRFSVAVLVVGAATLTLPGCSRRPASVPRRIALLPAEVLIADASNQWMSLAAPFVLAQDLAPAPDVIATLALNDSGVYQSASASELQTTLEGSDRKIAVHATLRDVAASRNLRVFPPATGNFIDNLDALAKQIDARAVPFPTRNEHALASFVQALSAADPTRKRQLLSDAISADPSFGLAYVSLLQLLSGSGASDWEAVLRAAAAHETSFAGVDRARFEVLRTRLDLPGGRAPLAQQTAAAVKLVDLTPHDTEALGAAGESLFLEGNAAQGEALFRRALAVSPDDPGLRQKLALGLVETRQYARAAGLFGELAPDPNALLSKAIAQLLAGDRTGASAAFEKFTATLGNADLAALLSARWQALSGHRKTAIAQLGAAHFNDPRVAALARSETAIWELMEKQPAAARAAAHNAGPAAELLAAGASSASEWRARVASLPAGIVGAGVRDSLLRYGYFLLGFYPDAADAWREADRQAGGTSLDARVMLAASLRAAGRAGEAAKVRVQPFVPDLNQAFSTVSFAELRPAPGQDE